jgi:hypothetical protein
MSKKAIETSNALTKKAHLEAEKEKTLSLDPKVIKPFSQYVDSVMYSCMQTAYGEFVSLTDPILMHDVIDGMVNKCERQLPHHWKQLQSLLGFSNSFKKMDASQPLLSKEHLTKFYRQMTLYELKSLCRVCNSHHFVNWACVLTAVMYGQSNLDVSRRVPTFFSFSASLTTLATKTRGT